MSRTTLPVSQNPRDETSAGMFSEENEVGTRCRTRGQEKSLETRSDPQEEMETGTR